MTTSTRGPASSEGAPVGLAALGTETANPRTADLDAMGTLEVLQVINAEDQTVAGAVQRVLPAVARAVDLVVAARQRGGRLVYVGAGTSGRLGLLDAVECPPTFGTAPQEVVGVLAGGDGAFAVAVEGAEDDPDLAVADLEALGIGPADVVVGLAASGRTPYVVAALHHAGQVGAATVSVACNPGSPISALADVAIEVDTGPEVITGSTRLKAGTAQKMVCNMLSTAAMVRTGKVYRNLMVDVRPTNAKLVDRARRIVATAATVDEERADAALRAADGHAKTAVVMLLAGCGADEARARLARHGGRVREAVTG
ncbi:N-acetylmuramic acid 6-phosphate etherase [Friedmanniella luteola]|uniref:N-acetylmuramic acid 6-phosphate etherase n=2 Tax=Friedmanniella luteola TaxID=546871 RepID=A0A1H1M2W3_9ACTN|nr:N-acetylmuramic acid 6-phosphate etherase [Friedmanniella luteola]SDR81133.1 N-acetylmuramic acid 6-phosphate etherase [Friedmanniella luteola]